MSKTLVVIDIQNDYFATGAFPLWDVDATLDRAVAAVHQAQARGIPVVLVQHIADATAPFFQRGTPGAELHPRLRAAAGAAPVVVKAFADGFERTTLAATLDQLGTTELLVAGMMTQNCVTHTAISKAAERYDVAILPDLCTTVSQPIHLIALNGVSTRVRLVPSSEALG